MKILKKKKTEDFELLRIFFLFLFAKIAKEIAGATNNIVQISFVVTSTCFEQVSRCQAFSEKFKKIISFLFFFCQKKSCYFEKNIFLSPLDFLRYLHCFLERERGGKSCQFSIVKKVFCYVCQYVFHGKKFTLFLFS